MKQSNDYFCTRRAAAFAALAAALVLAAPTVAQAAMTKDQVAQKIEKEILAKFGLTRKEAEKPVIEKLEPREKRRAAV